MFDKGEVKASTFTPNIKTKKEQKEKRAKRETGGIGYEYSFIVRKRGRERVREPQMDTPKEDTCTTRGKWTKTRTSQCNR